MESDELNRANCTNNAWLDVVAKGDKEAMAQVFSRYHDSLVSAARQKISSGGVDGGTPSDCVMSAFRTFLLGVNQGRYSFSSESKVWGLLYSITLRKIRASRRKVVRRRSLASKFSSLPKGYETPDSFDCEDPSALDPGLLAGIEEEARNLILLFPENRRIREILELGLEGWTTAQISAKLGLVPRTVQIHMKKALERFATFARISELPILKFSVLSEVEVAEELETSPDWVAYFLNVMLDCWSRERNVAYNSSQWISLIKAFFETGEIVLPKRKFAFWNAELTEERVLQVFETLGERWKDAVFGRWRSPLLRALDEYETLTSRASKSA